MKKYIGILLLGAFSLPVNAGYVVYNATITAIESNVSNNQDKFVLHMEGGTGDCATRVEFPIDASVSADAHKRTYSAALTALTTGLTVNVHNYEGNNCERASLIRIMK